MPEDRGFPRFLPRIGKRIRIAFGDAIDFDATFGDLRARWKALVVAANSRASASSSSSNLPTKDVCGILAHDELRDGDEARRIRTEVARRMRDEVMKLRQKLGYPDGPEGEDPAYALAETWAAGPPRTESASRVTWMAA